MKTWIYVDGFNLYYGALKGTPYKWLNPVRLANLLLPQGHIVDRLRYFTALVSSKYDPAAPARQRVYLNALSNTARSPYSLRPVPCKNYLAPTHASWLNQVERWFGIITQQAIRRGTFSSVKQLTAKIERFVDEYNANTRAFVWTATADSILEKVERLSKLISGTRH